MPRCGSRCLAVAKRLASLATRAARGSTHWLIAWFRRGLDSDHQKPRQLSRLGLVENRQRPPEAAAVFTWQCRRCCRCGSAAARMAAQWQLSRGSAAAPIHVCFCVDLAVVWHVASPQALKFEHGRAAKLGAQVKGSAKTCFCAGEFIAGGSALSNSALSL